MQKLSPNVASASPYPASLSLLLLVTSETYANVRVKVEEKKPDRVKRTSQAVRTPVVVTPGEERREVIDPRDRRTVEEVVPTTVWKRAGLRPFLSLHIPHHPPLTNEAMPFMASANPITRYMFGKVWDSRGGRRDLGRERERNSKKRTGRTGRYVGLDVDCDDDILRGEGTGVVYLLINWIIGDLLTSETSMGSGAIWGMLICSLNLA